MRPDQTISREEYLRLTMSQDVWRTEVDAKETTDCYKVWLNKILQKCKDMTETEFKTFLTGAPL